MKTNNLPTDFDQSLWQHTSIQKIVSHALPDKKYTKQNVAYRLRLIRWAEYAAAHYIGKSPVMLAHKRTVDAHIPLVPLACAYVLNTLVDAFKATLTPAVVIVRERTSPNRGRSKKISLDQHIDAQAERNGQS